MKLLQRIYDHYTQPIQAEHDRKLKAAKNKIMAKDGKARRSKFEYREKCLHLNRVEQSLEAERIRKINKWNWLKRLI